MRDIFGNYIDILVISCLAIFMPILMAGRYLPRSSVLQMKEASYEFLDRVRRYGEISLTDANKLQTELLSEGQAEMRVTHYRAMELSGGVTAFAQRNSEEVMECISRQGTYCFEDGDYVELVILQCGKEIIRDQVKVQTSHKGG